MKSSSKPVYGINPVAEAVHAGKEIERIFIERQSRSEGIRRLKQLLKSKGITWTDVPEEKLRRLAGANHQGVVCFISEIEYQKTDNLLPAIFEAGRVPLILILDRITDVRNIGAIARTASCMGVDFIMVPDKGSAMINADAVKTSAGALLHIHLVRESNLAKAIQFLKDSGVRVVGCTEKAEALISRCDFTHPTAIVLGSEENGIGPEILRKCDDLVKIPMSGKIASLNVATAAGIALYEASRQRMAV
jgi:23S rRNA (guanosine2251-2'-O)-methyltransferase